MEFDLEDTIRTLASEYGEKRFSRKHGTEYIAIPKDRRKDILRHLANTAKNLGQDKDFFKKGTVRTTIAQSVFPEALTEFWDNKKTHKSYAAVHRELDEVLAEIWPNKTFATEATKKIEEWNPAKHGRLGRPFDESSTDNLPAASALDDEAADILGLRK